MIELVKIEFSKIVCKKLILVLGILVIILSVLYNGGYRNEDNKRNIAKKYENKQYSKEQIDSLYKSALDNMSKDKKLTDEDKFIVDNFFPTAPRSIKATYYILNNEVNYDGIKKHIKALEEKNAKSTYEYKVFSKAEKMTGKLGDLKYKYLGAWAEININADIAGVLILVMITVGLSSVFSDEYTLNTAPILFSTKRGKTKLTIAKIIAGLGYAAIVFASVTALFFLNIILNGHGESKLPFNLFAHSSPYNFTIGSEYGVSLILSFIGVIAFSLLVMIFSLTFKKSMITLIASVGIYFLPAILNMVARRVSTGIIGMIKNINFKAMVESTYLFNEFQSFNILGNAVMKPVVLTVISTIFIVAAYIGIKHLGKKQVIA